MLFSELSLNSLIVKAVEEQSYKLVTPIQEKSIPSILEGMDLLGCASTGTGKTAAFALPILDKLYRDFEQIGKSDQIKALILAPTRELAIQIGESFERYGQYLGLGIGVVYGGVTPKRHIKVLKRQPNILVATPGRLLDLVDKQVADLSHVECLVLDEADQMLDLVMKKEVNRIISLLPNKRQNLLFSATIPKEIEKFIKGILVKPVKITIEKSEKQEKSMTQRVYFVEETQKTEFLLELLKKTTYKSVLIFTRTKKKADKVSKAINVSNICRSKAIHGDKNQSERQKNLDLFKNKEVQILVATDLAARGLDIDNVSLVINMNIPEVAKTYIHRIGRTARAGLSGQAISLCSQEEKPYLNAILEIEGNIEIEGNNSVV